MSFLSKFANFSSTVMNMVSLIARSIKTYLQGIIRIKNAHLFKYNIKNSLKNVLIFDNTLIFSKKTEIFIYLI